MTLPFERALGEELVRSAERDQRRRHRRRMRGGIGGAVAAVAAGIAAAVAVLAPSSASADVEVWVDDGTIVVELAGGRVDGDELLDALHDEGVDVVIEEEPAGPSRVGHAISVVVAPGDPLGSREIDIRSDADGEGQIFTIPQDWFGTLTIVLGRRAEEGEGYTSSSDTFDEGEPLHCSGIYGLTLREAARRASIPTPGSAWSGRCPTAASSSSPYRGGRDRSRRRARLPGRHALARGAHPPRVACDAAAVPAGPAGAARTVPRRRRHART